MTSLEMQGSMAPIGNGKLVPWSADDTPSLLRQLEGKIFFKTTLTVATAASCGKSAGGLTVPSWFVREHGDKVCKSATLRTDSSSKSWPVNLTIWYPSKTVFQVKFAGGWQAFAIFNCLREADELIFELMAKSEFKVHLIRGNQGPSANPSAKRKRMPGAAKDSAIAPIPSPNILRHLPSFWKTLTTSNVCLNTGASLEFPEDFWRAYGGRIHSEVELQGIHEHSPVRTLICSPSPGKGNRHSLGAEWLAFALENHLREGQQLVFTLSADSFFVVRERSEGIVTDCGPSSSSPPRKTRQG